MISERTKSALQAAKARGRVLGNPRLAEASAKGRAVTAGAAKRFAENLMPAIREIKAAGATSNAAIAAKLNERKIPTARGGRWTHVQVGAILARAVA
jgi:DNA invertase Pin-like site-specific DNA recombinase